MRTLLLPKGVYKYRTGKQHVVIIHPNGSREVVDYSTLTGRSWDTIEDGHWDGGPDGMITPADIKRYLEARP